MLMLTILLVATIIQQAMLTRSQMRRSFIASKVKPFPFLTLFQLQMARSGICERKIIRLSLKRCSLQIQLRH